MRTVIRWSVSAVVVAHGLIHLLGAAKGFGWADVPQLHEPISFGMGVVWLAAAVLVTLAGVLLAITVRWWWVVGAVAMVVSQSAILTSWSDAGAGTVPNIILLAAVVYGYASEAPTSFRAEYRHRVSAALIEPITEDVVTMADLARLPGPVATYLRRSGAIGQPRVRNFRARIHGRIRAAATKPWMSFTGEQVNTYGAEPSSLFFMDATMFGLPVDVFHLYVGSSATMRVKVCSMVPMVKASGPAMDRAETVTLFNDLCILAPAALVDARVSWRQTDDNHVRGEFTNAANTVTAELVFNDNGDLIDFVSDDRLRASQDGHSFTPQRWSTPVHDYRTFGSRRVSAEGEARWHAPDAEGEFAYLELSLDEITYNVTRGLLGRRSELSTVSV
jgi:hypothetical protein